MIVSTAIEVFPVLRSPMISSRCPRPRANKPSIVRMPVWTGSVTSSRSMIDGAGASIGSCAAASIGGPPSSGRPSGSMTRPSRPGPTGVRITAPVPCTVSPASTASASSSRTQPIRSASRVWANPNCPLWNRSTSSSRTEGRPEIMAIPSPMVSTRPKSSITGPSWAVATRLTAFSSHGALFVIPAQLLGDVIQIRPPVVAQRAM